MSEAGQKQHGEGRRPLRERVSGSNCPTTSSATAGAPVRISEFLSPQAVIADMQAEKGEAVAKEIGGTFVKCA